MSGNILADIRKGALPCVARDLIFSYCSRSFCTRSMNSCGTKRFVVEQSKRFEGSTIGENNKQIYFVFSGVFYSLFLSFFV